MSKNPPNVMASDDGDDNNNILLETFNPFTTLTTILQCLGGLSGWRHLFVNETSSLRMDSMQCPGFRCEAGAQHCCCCHVSFTQPDFYAQKSELEEHITLRGHICDFYPKFHCELRFIEQYWGAVKWQYCSSPKITDIGEMEKNVINCLDDIPLLQIQRFVVILFATWFIKLYHTGMQTSLQGLCTGSNRVRGSLG